MLDYQINESISKAYVESVCGCGHKKAKKIARKNVNEDGKNQNIKTKGFWQTLKEIWDSPSHPAWVEEPTGFNLAAPEHVFKDVDAGLRGYRKGEKIGLATGLGMLGAGVVAESPAVAAAALNIGNKLGKVSSIAKGAAAGYGLDKGTQYIDKKLDDNNLGYIRPTVDGLSELGQWTVGLPYKVGQMVKDTYDETLDEYEKSKGQHCQFMGCTFIGKTEDDLKNHYINDHKCTPKK
jgi:hypothetical protein